jgi:hypothetical protein
VEVTLTSTDILVVCLAESIDAFVSKCRMVPDEFVRFDGVWYWNQERNRLLPQEGGLEGYATARYCRRGAIVSVVPFQENALPILNLSRESRDEEGPPSETGDEPEPPERR